MHLRDCVQKEYVDNTFVCH